LNKHRPKALKPLKTGIDPLVKPLAKPEPEPEQNPEDLYTAGMNKNKERNKEDLDFEFGKIRDSDTRKKFVAAEADLAKVNDEFEALKQREVDRKAKGIANMKLTTKLQKKKAKIKKAGGDTSAVDGELLKADKELKAIVMETGTIFTERQQVLPRYTAAKKAKRLVEAEASKEGREALIRATGNSFAEPLKLKMSSGIKKDTNDGAAYSGAAEFYGQLAGTEALRIAKGVSIGPTSENRSFAVGSQVSMGPHVRDGSVKANAVLVHEITHPVEQQTPGQVVRSVQFIEKRQIAKYGADAEGRPKGQTAMGGGYGANEKTYDDSYEGRGGSRYSGLMYNYGAKLTDAGERARLSQATELLSMGAQRLYEDPVGFLDNDPDYFYFTLAGLQGDDK
jgi:hypothetical protein